MSAPPDPETFLSGDPGDSTRLRRRLKGRLADGALDLLALVSARGGRLDRLAARQPARRVLVLSIYRPGSLLARALPALRSERHTVELVLGATGSADPALRSHTRCEGLDGGKFENLNRLLKAAPAPGSFDWTVVIDDDVGLPRRFLDRLLALCERFDLALAQPAQTWRSHAAWRVTRRRPFSLVRETRFVEIGPVTVFRREAASALIPFPDLRWGWGLDLHWAAIAAEHGWRIGVVDAVPVRHEATPVAVGYTHAEAIEEAARFLTARPYVHSSEAVRTVATHRRLAG